MSQMKNWILAARPKTLSASLIPILCATSLAYKHNPEIALWPAFLAFAIILCVQIACNLINDVADFAKGADQNGRIGPTRVTQAGLIEQKKVWQIALAFLAFALLLAIPIFIYSSFWLLALGLVCLLMAYAYTAGPLPLAYNGLGDIFVFVFFGLIPVGFLYYVLMGSFDTSAWVLGAQMGFLSCVLIAINNFRDQQSDKLVNKKTLAVLFGPNFVRWEISFCYLMFYLLNCYWLQKEYFLAAFMPFFLVERIYNFNIELHQAPASGKWNSYLAIASFNNISFAILLSLSFIYSVV